MRKFVSVTTANDMIAAHTIKSSLESSGFECVLENESIVAANPLLASAVGGIIIKVSKEDLSKAKEILGLKSE